MSDCTKCNQEHYKCSAHSKQTGGPCMSGEVVPGGISCAMHGGKAPQALKAARERENRRIMTELYDADPQAAIAAYGTEAIDDPLDMLSRLAASSAHTMEAMGKRVNDLQEIRYENDKGGEQIRGEVKLYMAAMAQTGKFLDMLIKSGFEERRVKLDEQTAGMFVTAMQQVLARLELSPEQAVLVGTVVPEVLRSLESA